MTEITTEYHLRFNGKGRMNLAHISNLKIYQDGDDGFVIFPLDKTNAEWMLEKIVSLGLDPDAYIELRTVTRTDWERVTPNIDPKPWVYALLGPAKEGFTPARAAEQITGGFAFDPRPEYSQNKEDYS